MANEEKFRDYLKLVTANLRQTRRRLAEVEERSQEPIAIVGMGCRFPGGAQNPDELWNQLASGTDAIGPFPHDRGWDNDTLYDPDPDHPGTSYARHGGFLYDAAEFDANFFGISPREALMMDPQQRQLLEVSWEALERTGINPASLRGTPTGVFIGGYSSGYGMNPDPEAGGSEGHMLTGVAGSVLSGRVSFTFGFEGPAVTVDTACSSSLVALHMAVQALRGGECSLALVGGTTVIATPAVFVGFSRQRGMSVDGRCKSFSASAEGSGWAEGVGVVVAERLSDARRNGHRILAVVRGSAVNQDGASNGLTAPNGPSQQRVIRAALANARLSASDVDVVEAHGSATTLGDPIEAEALIATYGQERPNGQPLWLGSVKSNIGHAQAAAGVAGVIKMVLALQNEQLPATLHADRPTSHVDWSAGEVRLLQEPVAWPAGDRVRRAGVSAFGMSGTNVHVLLEEAPAVSATVVESPDEDDEDDAPIEAEDTAPELPVLRAGDFAAWPVSARSSASLERQAGRLREWVAAHPDTALGDVGWSLAASRSVFEHRAVALGGDRPALSDCLGTLATAGSAAGVVSGVSGTGVRPVFVFAGQGSQWVGMGRRLLAESPVFAARLAECERALAPLVDWSLSEKLSSGDSLDTADVVQPVLWAVMVSLAAVWEASGVTPQAVVGHSQGEIAAATVAGLLSVEDAARVVVARSRALSSLSVSGSMVSVVMPSAAVEELVRQWDGRLSVAAVNGPATVVVSGEQEALAEFERTLARQRVLRWRVPETDFVAHSPLVEPLEAVLAAELADIAVLPGRVPMVSTVTGDWLGDTPVDAAYWFSNLRRMVRFEQAVRVLVGAGHTAFVEVSPHPVLTAAIEETAEGVSTVGTLERDHDDAARVLKSLAQAWVAGLPVDWKAVLPAGELVDLPTYAFDHDRYWLRSAPATVPGTPDRNPAADWRYRVTWAPINSTGPATLTGTWLVVTAPGQARPDITAALEARGAEVVAVDDSADLSPYREVTGVVSLLALDETPTPDFPAVTRGLAATLALLQALDEAGVDAPRWVLTSAAVTTGPDDAAPSPAQAQIWGLGRVAALEQPDRWGGLIDLPAVLDDKAAARLAAVLAGTGEDQVAIRPSGLLARRLTRAPQTRTAGRTWQPRGTTLVTGGTGAAPEHTVRWLASRAAPRIVLIDRLETRTARLAAELAAAGTGVDVVAADCGDRSTLTGLLTWIGPELTAVVHTAEAIDDGPLSDLGVPELASVLAATAGSAALLDELTGDLDAFVLFSSVAAVWGGGQQPAFSAANASLDALAERRIAAGKPATAIAWGPWRDGSMSSGADGVRLERRGLRLMAPDSAIALLAYAVDSGEAPVTVADVDWARFVPPFTLRRPSPLIESLPDVRQTLVDSAAADTAADTGPDAGTPLRQQLAGQSAAEQERTLVSLVRSVAAAVLEHASGEAIGSSRAFSDLGFDSLTAVELRNRLSAATGLRLPATLLFDYPTPAVLAGYLRDELLGVQDGSAAGPVFTAAADDDPVAIVGMACRFPGSVRTPEHLWELLSTGTDAIGAFPQDRGWDLDNLYDPDPDQVGTAYVRQGGFVYDATEFDSGFFGISPREALAMDPQQRLLLEVSWEALERAGLDQSALRGSRTGVFAGGSFAGYGISADTDSVEAHLLTGTTTSVLSGRISYTFGLEGPAVTVDTACSSALVAVYLAGQALRSGECSLAVAGGAFVAATPDLFVWTSRQRGLAPDGRSKSFGAAADGMGIAEGAGMVVLERLSDARRNGHPVLAVIRGSAINQDGASNGLTAPNGPSQQRVIRAALASAQLTPADVDVVEAHGSGTVLGDPIEAQAVIAAYGQDRPQGRPLWLGSVKSNIGHAQAAAGIGGLIKMVLALQHRQLPKTLHSQEASPHVDWSAGDVRLLTEARPWSTDDGRPRRAGISSFGVSGTNAHLIIEEPADEPAAQTGAPAGPGILDQSDVLAWPVSARTAEGLRMQAARLLEYVTTRPGLDPADVARSLATTRSLFEYRTVVTGAGRDELIAGLTAVAAGETPAGVVTGLAAADDEGEPVFVFPGQGAQYVAMGRELAACSPVFAARLADCEQALARYVDWSLTDVLRGAEGAPELERADVVQPALWAVLVSLAAVWEAAGVTPGAVVGHSQGEIAAATVAGILTLDDAAKVVAVRSQALSALGTGGGMLSVVMPDAAVRELLEPWGDRLSVAAVNGPAATVVSGETEALAEFEAALSRRRVLRWRIPVTDFVAHSAGIDGIAATLVESLAGIQPAEARIPMFSTVECRFVEGPELGPDYWFANVRRTVRFAEAIRELAAAGNRTFLEVSPQPVLTTGIAETIEELGAPGTPVITGTLEREHAGARRLLESFARLHVSGTPVDWTAVLTGGQRTDLPTYAFQRQRFWLHQSRAAAPRTRRADGTVTEAEALFWDAVENTDLRQLTDTLAVDAARPFGEVIPALASWRRREHERDATGTWRYRVTWAPVTDPPPAVPAGNWLVVVPANLPESTAALAQACVRALSVRGVQARVIEVAAGTAGREDLAAELGATPPAGVFSLLALDETPAAGSPFVPAGLAATLAVLQAMTDAELAVPLWTATSGAISSGPGDPTTHPIQTQTWGLGRVIALEQPERWGGLIDLPAVLDDRAAARLCTVLAGCDEDQVAIRPAGILGRRLGRAPQPRQTGTWAPRGTVLITGGTGAIGGHVARWLADRERAGSEPVRIVLAARSGPAAAGAAHLAADLATAGTHVEVTACDSAERADLAALIDRIQAGGPPLTAVVHAAGVLADGVLDRLDTDRLAAALAAKAGGAVHLDELTADLDLDQFVMFSSAAATFGGAGQANYAAANAFLDGLAENRRARGRTALTVAWGPWAGDGVSQASEAARQRLRRNRWEVLMEPRLAVKALGQALAGPDTVMTVMHLDWPALAAAPGAAELLRVPFLRDLPDAQTLAASLHTADTGPKAEGELVQRLAGLSRTEQDRVLVDTIRDAAAGVLGYSGAEQVEPSRAFSELGFDSLTAVELRNRIAADTGLQLPATLLFDYPSPMILAEHLRGELLGALADNAAAPAATAAPAADGEPLAIVGMSCRFPGEVNSPDRLWQLLAAGGDGVSTFPEDRGWNTAALFDPDPGTVGTTYSREGGFLHQATEFDPGFFGISPREAVAMDPQQRLVLELAWEAVESAGLDPAAQRGARTGVFIGGYSSSYAVASMQLAAASGAAHHEGHLVTGNATSIISGRVSYTLGLEGPAVTVDTACSSSLVALHMAGQALRSGECSMALVGGVSVMATPWEMVAFARQRGLASDGRSKAFSADADGMGMGEGAGMLVLERLSDARRHGHQVLAVVRGSAINQDGASNGLTAPNGPSQQRVIRAALASADLTPSDVDVVEAHGTGTPLGDPIEAQALMATYGRERPDDRPLWLGSVKSNLGHTQAAAGVAGIIKMVLALRHGQMPRTLHAAVPSPHIDWTAGEVRLLQEPVAWPSGERVRRAGVSAFGISGTNAHVIIEEAPAEVVATEPEVRTPVLPGAGALLVSGRSAEALAGQAGRLREWLTAYPELAPEDVAWSLATTRSVFEHRAVVLGTERDDLLSALANLATGQDAAPVVTGVARPDVRVGLIFAGQGSQWSGMGRSLYEGSAVFAEAFDEVCALLDVPVRDLVLGADGVDESLADQTLYAQTGLFAFEVALAAVVKAAGVTAHAVVGHSVGEIAAAYVAGVLSLPDACRLVAARARAMQECPAGGAMAAINAPEADVVASLVDGVEVASVNGPDSVVVSGDLEAVRRILEHWHARGRRVSQLRVSHAFHSAAMEPALASLADVAAGLDHRRPTVLWAGALDGSLVGEPGSDYWAAQTRGAVRFGDALQTLVDQGISVFLEVGPDGSLSALGPDGGVFIPLQRRNGGDLLTGLARAYVHGAGVDWTALLPTGKRVGLPTYAFQHDRYWPEGVLAAPTARGTTDAEAEFWAAVDNGDLAGLADTLDLPDQQAGELLPALASWRRREQERSVTAGWRYRVSWEPVADTAPGVLSGRWVVVTGSADELTRACADVLTGRGADVTVLETGETTDQARLAESIGALVPENGLSGVLSLLALDETPTADHPALANGLAGTQTLIQALITLRADAPLWMVTRGAVAAVPGDTLASPVQAQAWGIGRVSALEHPDHGGGLIDLPAEFDERTAAQLAEVLAGIGEDQVAIRPAGILGRRLVHAPLPGGVAEPWRPRGTVLITGGTGAIAGHVARWLADRDAPRLVLTSRSGPGAGNAAALAAELATAGSRVDVISCDAGDEAALAGAVARIGTDGPPLTAVMHTAGLGQNTALDETSMAELATVVTAKTAGAAILDRATADLDLDAFVMFSSISATWGSGLQGGYAAANTFLDALAENRLHRGLPATSVAWGPWAGGGMTDVEDADAMQRRGVQLMRPEHAVQALAQVLDRREGLMTVADVDWARFAPPFTMRRSSPLIESLPEVVEALAANENRTGPAGSEAGSELARQLAGLSPDEQDRLLTDLVRTHAAVVLGHAGIETVEADRAFTDLGADSLTAVELRDRLTAATGLYLPSTLLFDYPTPAALAAYLRATQNNETSPAEPVLAELEKLDGMLAAITGGADSAQITNRLEVVLAKWKESLTRDTTASVADKLESSTDDEVFDFIEKELGIN
ncbi:hypothetical protein KRMM14A1259_03760 [Krasilnikovia sp. MM14-A1259]